MRNIWHRLVALDVLDIGEFIGTELVSLEYQTYGTTDDKFDSLFLDD